MTHAWDGIASSSGYAKWDNEGDSVKGTVTDVGIGQDMNGNDCPQIIVDTGDGDGITVSASQAQLRSKLIEARPNVGDTIAIVFTGVEKRSGGKTLKQFDVAVKPGAGGSTEDLEPVGAPNTAGKPSAADLL